MIVCLERIMLANQGTTVYKFNMELHISNVNTEQEVVTDLYTI